MKLAAARRSPRAAIVLAACLGLAAACDTSDTPDGPNPPNPPFPQPGYCEPSSSGALTLQPIVTDLNAPMYVTAPPADERLYVVERGGKIRLWDGGQIAATPHVKRHALVASDYAVKLVNRMFPGNLEKVREMRETQIFLLEQV